MNWHVVSVNSRCEIELAARISEAGFVAVCPVYEKRIRMRHQRAGFLKMEKLPLFSGYIFVAQDDAFRKDLFETGKIRLTVFRKSLLTDTHMRVINQTASELTLAQSKTVHGIQIKRGDMMQLLNCVLQGEPVEVLEARKNRIFVRFKYKPEWKDAWVDRAALGKAI